MAERVEKAPIHPTALYSPAEVTILLGVSLKTVKRLPLNWIRQGHRTKRILGEDVLAYLRGQRSAA
jgi:hypothetical protein